MFLVANHKNTFTFSRARNFHSMLEKKGRLKPLKLMNFVEGIINGEQARSSKLPNQHIHHVEGCNWGRGGGGPPINKIAEKS